MNEVATQQDDGHNMETTHESVSADLIMLPTDVNTDVTPTLQEIESDMMMVKKSDLEKMKNLILSLRQDTKDKEAFADVTRRLMYLVDGVPKKTVEIKKIIQYIDSCFSAKNGKRKFSLLKLGKKLIVGDIPLKEFEALGGALNADAFKGFKPIDYGDAFNRNQIPMVDISPFLNDVLPFFNNQKEDK